MNRAEYSNAIRDWLAVDIQAGSMLPVDDSGYGFDNIADVLSMSPALLKRYLSAARLVSRLAVGDMQMKPVEERFLPLKDPPSQVAAVTAYRRSIRVWIARVTICRSIARRALVSILFSRGRPILDPDPDAHRGCQLRGGNLRAA